MDPVIVVGAGSVGLALTLALARRDVPVILLDEGPGRPRIDEQRPARTAVLRPDTAQMLSRLGCAVATDGGARWAGWRTMRRRQTVRQVTFDDSQTPRSGAADAPPALPAPRDATAPDEPSGIASPLHLPQHVLTRSLRAALASFCQQPGGELVRIATGGRLDAIEQDEAGVSVHTRPVLDTEPADEADAADPGEAPATEASDSASGPEAKGIWWRGSYVIGCDGRRSTVRKLLRVRFPGRTAVERHAVAALRADLPFPGEGLLHRLPPWRGADAEATARPLPGGAWRLDWLLPPGGDLVTPEALLSRVRDTLTGWCGTLPPYELLDTGVYLAHHRLARRWRVGRAFLAGDAAHLIGALGTQGLDEGLRDVDNLAWKLALTWHHGAGDQLLDSYQTERRGAVGARLRTADQLLSQVRAPGGWSAVRRSVLPGSVRNHDALLTDGHAGLGQLGAPPSYQHSPLQPAPPEGAETVDTAPGSPVADVPVTAPDGSLTRLRSRLGGALLVVLVAPGTGVWERRHWVGAAHAPPRRGRRRAAGTGRDPGRGGLSGGRRAHRAAGTARRLPGGGAGGGPSGRAVRLRGRRTGRGPPDPRPQPHLTTTTAAPVLRTPLHRGAVLRTPGRRAPYAVGRGPKPARGSGRRRAYGGAGRARREVPTRAVRAELPSPAPCATRFGRGRLRAVTDHARATAVACAPACRCARGSSPRAAVGSRGRVRGPVRGATRDRRSGREASSRGVDGAPHERPVGEGKCAGAHPVAVDHERREVVYYEPCLTPACVSGGGSTRTSFATRAACVDRPADPPSPSAWPAAAHPCEPSGRSP